MEESEASNKLLKDKYNLHTSREIGIAEKRTQMRTGKKVPQNPLDRIQNYLNRFHEIVDQKDSKRGEHGLDLIKGRFHSKYVIKPDEIPEAYFDNQRRLAREQGHGDIEITPQARNQLTEVIIADQTSSLDKWIDYLSSPDAPYPDALKYFTLRSVVNMAEYDKERKMYPQRSKGTTKPFPDLNREALAYVLDAVDKKYKGQQIDLPSLEAQESQEFEKLIQGENFAKLYAWAIEKVTPATEEELSGISGHWVKYEQGSDPIPLSRSLEGHGTNWCTVGESTARVQLQGGDFYVYYSLDSKGKPTVPRAAIRMEENRIAEVRGIADKEQNMDPYIMPVVEEKLKEFPDGTSYQKRVSDMRRLTNIENQIKEGHSPTGEDLAFLYEINAPIEGFGYSKDPRIGEIRSQRNLEEDMPIVFGCSRDQIAGHASEIRSDTKAYVGPLEAGIFDKLPANLEQVYTSFPESKIRRETIEIGGKSVDQLEREMEQAGIQVYDYAKDILHSSDFTTLPTPVNIDTIILTVADLGFSSPATTDQIYAKAKELGLELCPAEVGPHKRLKDTNQPTGDWEYIAMKQIADRNGDPDVFFLARHEVGLWLRSRWAGPDSSWLPRFQFVFSLRKFETQTLKSPGPLDRIFRR
ncbi:MAG: hypothetical protein HY426_00975 [Candidatus Levybacteria bacterium]|nr:hypothetical protein [Candidatus Levybacteria bacterium]